MSYVWAHLWQFAVAVLLMLRASNAVVADLRDARVRRSYGITGILLCEATYVVLFIFALWMGGFW